MEKAAARTAAIGAPRLRARHAPNARLPHVARNYPRGAEDMAAVESRTVSNWDARPARRDFVGLADPSAGRPLPGPRRHGATRLLRPQNPQSAEASAHLSQHRASFGRGLSNLHA